MHGIIILFALCLTFWGCTKVEEPGDNTIKVKIDHLSHPLNEVVRP
jgi:hypothetical protein